MILINKQPLDLKTAISNALPLYILPKDPVAQDILIPALQASHSLDVMMGYFSSNSFAEIAPGLATFIKNTKAPMRMIISPFLTKGDFDTLTQDEVEMSRLASSIFDTPDQDAFVHHTLECLAWLITEERLVVKVAIMRDALFHPKVWLFQDQKYRAALHGSTNFTKTGLAKNHEQLILSRDWRGDEVTFHIKRFRHEFDNLWAGGNRDCHVLSLPDAVKRKIIEQYKTDDMPKEEKLISLWEQARDIAEPPAPPYVLPKAEFKIPSYLSYESGDFEHQGEAIKAWLSNGYKGILEMATGSGKTITAMICAYRLYEKQKPLLIVVAAPYVPLIEQWCDEIKLFGIKPINLSAVGNASRRKSEIQKLKRRLRTRSSKVEVIVVSHDTLCTSEFLNTIEEFDCARLLIADEVHNLGRPSFINNLPQFFENRLGLSATPVRQYDEQGTKILFDFFGYVFFQFTLKDAIGRCLVEYDYYVHPVYLTEDEMYEWFVLTRKIKQNAWRDEGGKPDEYLAKLLRDRRALLETASGKITRLKTLLKENSGNLEHTLIYTSDKNPEQLNNVNRLLREERIPYHQLTAEETANHNLTKQIIKSFQNNEIEILTAKRVLDEGVNIPQICKAFILASTTVERQWVQRRGRLLRTCAAIGKTHSVIHDFLALPQEMEAGIDHDARTLVRSELQRTQEFAKLARNAGRPDGPLTIIHKMVNIAYL